MKRYRSHPTALVSNSVSRLRSILLGWFRKAGESCQGCSLRLQKNPCVPQRHGLEGEESTCLFLKGLFATNSTRRSEGEAWSTEVPQIMVGLGNSSPALGSQESQVAGLCAELELLRETMSVGVSKYGESPTKR